MRSLEEAMLQSEIALLADNETIYCTVDDTTRVVSVPEEYLTLGVESDEKAKRVWFKFPRYVGNNGIDLSQLSVRINFRNANCEGDVYVVQDLQLSGDEVIFSWELTRKVTKYMGTVQFVVCAVSSNAEGIIQKEWNTTINSDCSSLEGLEVKEEIEQDNPDIIEYILANMGTVTEEEIEKVLTSYFEKNPIIVPTKLSDLEQDATHRIVTDEEKASWNSKLSQADLQSGIDTALEQAKESGEFKGEKGDKGEQGIQGIQGVQGEKGDKGDTGEQGMQGIQGVQGEKGDKGEQGIQGEKGNTGEKGEKGDTPVKGVDYYTEADKEEMVTLVLNALPSAEGSSY